MGLEPTKSKFKILLEPTEFQLDALPLSYDPNYLESAGIEPTTFQVLIGRFPLSYSSIDESVGRSFIRRAAYVL